MGFRITPAGNTEVWARNLSDGSMAVGFYNKLGAGAVPPAPCTSWNVSKVRRARVVGREEGLCNSRAFAHPSHAPPLPPSTGQLH